MRKEDLKKWMDSTRQTLDACRRFSKLLCDKPFDRGFIGELLVLDRILKTYGPKFRASAENGFQYVGSANKGWDISLTLGKRTVYLNAKATRMKHKKDGPYWVRQHADNFFEIKTDPADKKQRIGKEKSKDPNLFYVFVDVGTWISSGVTDFFTLSYKEAASICRKIYLGVCNNGKVRKNNSTDFHFLYKHIKNFKDQNFSRLFRK